MRCSGTTLAAFTLNCYLTGVFSIARDKASSQQCQFLPGFHCAASALVLPLSHSKGTGEGCEDNISARRGGKEV